MHAFYSCLFLLANTCLHSRSLDLVCVLSNVGGLEAGCSVSTTRYKTEPHLEEELVPSSHQCAEDTSHPTAENMALSLQGV